jgi:hypothetical protein
MVTVGTLQTGYPYAQDLSQVQRHQTLHPAREGSDIATCPVTPGLPPDEGGLRCQQCPAVPDLPSGAGGLWRHGVPRGTRPASRQGRAPVSPCVPRFQTRLLVREGSSITTWHMAMGHNQKGNTQLVYLLSWAHLPPTRDGAFLRSLTSGSS